jgi:hypothetical protein
MLDVLVELQRPRYTKHDCMRSVLWIALLFLNKGLRMLAAECCPKCALSKGGLQTPSNDPIFAYGAVF